MIWIHTGAVAAEVIQLLALWDWPMNPFVGEPMCDSRMFSITGVKQSVALR